MLWSKFLLLNIHYKILMANHVSLCYNIIDFVKIKPGYAYGIEATELFMERKIMAQHGGAQRIAAIGNGNAKNVILFIGDGMGDYASHPSA